MPATSGDGAAQFAQVIVDIDAPHLDEPFDYRVPDELRAHLQVGSLVQVRFAARKVNAYVVRLCAETTFAGRVAPVLKVISPLPLVTPPLLETISYLATRFAASRSQLLSFVAPPRRARVDRALADRFETRRPDEELPTDHPRRDPEGARRGARVGFRRVQTALPGERAQILSTLLARNVSEGHSALIIAPTASQATDILTELQAADPSLRVGLIDADQSPDRRYRTFLQARLGDFDVLVGTRSAVWTPLPNLGMIAVWEDGDDRHRERRAPYLESLDIAVARSHVEGVSLVALSYARSLKSQALVESAWAQAVGPSRTDALQVVPRVGVFDAYSAQREGPTGRTRLPDAAYRLIRTTLEEGPVLIQVPAAGAVFEGEDGRRRVGSDQIGQELSRAFPRSTVIVSSSTSGVVSAVDNDPCLVVATPGAEPRAAGGYASIVITGTVSALHGPRLDAPLQALRRWANALAQGRRRAPALLVGEVPGDLLDALVYWDPGLPAHQVWLTHQELGFPPSRWVVRLEGRSEAVTAALKEAEALLGKASVHFPGSPFSALTLVSREEILAEPAPGAEGADHVRVILSVAPRNIQVLMTALAQVRRDLSRAGRPLPATMVNPPSLADLE